MRRPQYLAVVRHEESQANVVMQIPTDELFYPVAGSDPEVGLTADGFLHGPTTGQRLARLFPPETPVDRLILSPFRRVRESADRIQDGLGYAPPRLEDSRLSKRSYGAFWNLTYKGLQELHPEEYQRYLQMGKFLYRAPGGGENYPDVFARVTAFVEEAVAPSCENLLVVTHSVVMLALQRQFEGLSDEEIVRMYEQVEIPNGHIMLYRRQDPSRPWERCQLAD
jgi:broad specificity phosphatase PhoE